MTTNYGMGCLSCGTKVSHGRSCLAETIIFEGYRHPERLAGFVVHAQALLDAARADAARATGDPGALCILDAGVLLHGLITFLGEHEGHELCVADEYGDAWPSSSDLSPERAPASLRAQLAEAAAALDDDAAAFSALGAIAAYVDHDGAGGDRGAARRLRAIWDELAGYALAPADNYPSSPDLSPEREQVREPLPREDQVCDLGVSAFALDWAGLWARAIAHHDPDPATWLTRVREGVEALGMAPEKWISLGPATLEQVTLEVTRAALSGAASPEKLAVFFAAAMGEIASYAAVMGEV